MLQLFALLYGFLSHMTMGDEQAEEVPGKWQTSFGPFAHEIQWVASP